jgi:glutamine cyclotransferase
MKTNNTHFFTPRLTRQAISFTLSLILSLVTFFCATHSFVATADAKENDLTKSQLTIIEPSIKKTAAHNIQSFTQGWIKDRDTFYESSGLYGRSFVQRYSKNKTITTNLSSRYFAEGLTLLNEQIYLLTWKEEILLVLDKDTLKVTSTLPYSGDGWGLTNNGSQLIMSNGSADLLFRNSTDLSITRRITVQLPLQLNELEYVDGVIWANDWNKDDIYAINSENGCLLAKIDLSALRKKAVKPNSSNVLNGIAYDARENGLWVTGKYWPSRYLIEYPSNRINPLKASTRC